jgi:hypothetical protein
VLRKAEKSNEYKGMNVGRESKKKKEEKILIDSSCSSIVDPLSPSKTNGNLVRSYLSLVCCALCVSLRRQAIYFPNQSSHPKTDRSSDKEIGHDGKKK